MSVINHEAKDKLFCCQKGNSPFSGLPLDRQKQHLEAHHIKEHINGGKENLENMQLLPIYEHLAIHFMRFRDESLSKDERMREFDTVMGRWDELNSEERDKFYQLVEEKAGIIVRFI